MALVLHPETHIPDLQDSTYVCHLTHASLNFRLSVQESGLICTEMRGNIKVPVLNWRLGRVGRAEEVREWVGVLSGVYVPRQGVRVGMGLKGGGGCEARDCNPSSILSPKNQYHNPFNYAGQKDLDPTNTLKANAILEKVVSLAGMGVVVGMDLAELENMPMVTVQASISLFTKMMDAICNEAIWTMPFNYTVRYSMIRLARKYLMDHLFLSNVSFFSSTSDDLKQKLKNVKRLAEDKDVIWPESGALTQLDVIESLMTYSKDTTPWWNSLFAAAGTILEAYSTKNPLKALPVVVDVFNKVESIVGFDHLVETQLLLDNLYIYLRQNPDDAVSYCSAMLKQTTSWTTIYSVLSTLEWGMYRDIVTPGHFTKLKEDIRALVQENDQNYAQSWRVRGKVGEILLKLRADKVTVMDDILDHMLATERNTSVRHVLEGFSALKVCVEPPLEYTTNLTPSSDFIGRSEELNQASIQLAMNKTVTIAGAAGSGKSDLADMLGVRSGMFDIVWKCDASSETSLFKGLKALGDHIGITDFKVSKLTDLFTSKKTLMIFDGMTDSFPIFNQIKDKVYSVVTTKDTDTRDAVKVKGLDLRTAIGYLKDLTGNSLSQSEVVTIAKSVENMPLNLKFVGSLVKTDTSSNVTNTLSALNRVKGTTVNISGENIDGRLFELIKTAFTRNSQALVVILSILSDKCAPESLYKPIFDDLEPHGNLQSAKKDIERYALARLGADKSTYTMQEVVQKVVLHIIGDYHDAYNSVVKKFAEAYGAEKQECKEMDLSLAKIAFEIYSVAKSPISLDELTLCINEAYNQICKQGIGQLAMPFLKYCENHLVKRKSEYANLYVILAKIYLELKNITEAKIWANDAVEMVSQESEYYPVALKMLAGVYMMDKQFDVSEEYFKKVIEMREALNDPKDLLLIRTYDALGDMYRMKAELHEPEQRLEIIREAAKWAIKAYHGKEGISTDLTNDPDLAESYVDMGILWYLAGQLDKAEEVLLKGLNILKNKFGELHPRLILAYDTLTDVYKSLKQFEKAGNYQNIAVEIEKKAYGTCHPQVAESYVVLAEIYTNQRDYEKALEDLKQALDIRESLYGDNSETLIDVWMKLAYVHELNGQGREAAEAKSKASALKELYPAS